ncbi:hypothetical protein [Leisingera daeponensis]|uniref:hypothetical protein n=1 Tax=Leisingera daeponensis TaxID=405746 RepID=UPI000415078F|nr:hypothetical protein [Leisingera daeponensis]
MNISEALSCLRVNRVVWIDDHFNQTAESLGKMLAENVETTKECGFPELSESLASFEYDEEQATFQIIQALTDISQERRDQILEEYLAKEDEMEPGAVKELNANEVEQVCNLLGVSTNDRWPFENYEEKLKQLCEEGDEHVCYMIDLKASRGAVDDTTGLEVVAALHTFGSKGTAFILTHEATVKTEANKEEALLNSLHEKKVDVPLCVVSKTRLAPDDDDPVEVDEALRVAIKRAGIRKNIHEILRSAKQVVESSFEGAMNDLTRIAPEQFEKFAVDKAYAEGVSETHVIERAVTARLSQGIRELFASDARAQTVAQNLRRLRSIPLAETKILPDRRLAAFHEAEIWEDGGFLNASYSQLVCGDVFSTTSGKKTWFVLLAPPCDLALRNTGRRGLETATLIPIRHLTASVKQAESHYRLPFTLKNKRWYCSLREAAPVRLATLDLATFRDDGCVRVDHDQIKPDGLMDGQSAIYEERTSLWREYAATRKEIKSKLKGSYEEPLQLVFAAPEGFNTIKSGKVIHNNSEQAIAWPLQRIGRIRMPYASAILNSFMGRMSRPAFEIDYIADISETPSTAPSSSKGVENLDRGVSAE